MYLFPLAQSVLDMVGVADWHLMAYVCIAFGALGYFLLQHGALRSAAWMTVGIVLLISSALLVAVTLDTSLENYILFSFCAIAAGGGVAFLAIREPVYAALGFATAVLSGAGVLFMQSALFVAAATMIVYAGATIIIFLFVLMFAQQSTLDTYDLKLNNPILATFVGAGLLIAIVASLQSLESFEVTPPEYSSATRPLSRETKLEAPSSTAGLGKSMFTEYLTTVELAGAILMVATIGAIAVAQRTVEVSGAK